MTDRTALELTLGSGSKGKRLPEERPLRFLMLSDLSGQAHEISGFSTRKVTIDNYDDLFASIAPSLPDPTEKHSGQAARLELTELEHLHPDYLVAKLPGLRELLDIGRALRDPATEQSALSRLAELTGEQAERKESSTVEAPASEDEGDNLLERLLGRPSSAEPRDRAKEKVDALIKSALQSSSASQPSTQSTDAPERVSRLLDERCRTVMQDPRFRTVERAWRGLHWLVSRLEDDEAEVHVVDVAKASLMDHLGAAAQQLDTSALHRALVDTQDGWDLIIGDYSFGLNPDDLMMIATLGALASRARAPFVAHGELSLVGCDPERNAIDEPWNWSPSDDELGQLWSELRAHPASDWVGLAAPRFLLRYPYGAKTDPTERFEFEELPARPERERFLWGNPGLACALLMGQAHTRGGARWPQPAHAQIEDLPTPIYDDGTGDAIQPPLEYLLNERARATAAQRGLIVFAGGTNTNLIGADGLYPISA